MKALSPSADVDARPHGGSIGDPLAQCYGQLFCTQGLRCCPACVTFAVWMLFTATAIFAICAAVGCLPGVYPAALSASAYLEIASARVSTSPLISEGTSPANWCRAF